MVVGGRAVTVDAVEATQRGTGGERVGDSAHGLAHVAQQPLQLARRLLATHITPLRNWEFLSNRMSSGQSFGRYISKAQAPSPNPNP